jgi:hypothetical protein
VQGVESETCRKTGNRIIPERETLDRLCVTEGKPYTHQSLKLRTTFTSFHIYVFLEKHLQNEEK